MHETSLVKYTLDAVEEKAQALGITQVSLIHLTVGALRGAVPELMERAFRLMIYGRPMFEDAALDIRELPVSMRCRQCGETFGCDDLRSFMDAACPRCGAQDHEVLSGDELRIDYFETSDGGEQKR